MMNRVFPLILFFYVFVFIDNQTSAQCAVEITNPQQGMAVYYDDFYNIKWHHKEVNIFLSVDNGLNYDTIEYQYTADTSTNGGWEWVYPLQLPANESNQYSLVLSYWHGECPDTVNFSAARVLSANEINPKKDYSLEIFPNPMTESTIIQFFNPNGKRHTISIYNINGKLIMEKKNILTDKVFIKGHELSLGMYFITLSNENTVLSKSRLVVK